MVVADKGLLAMAESNPTGVVCIRVRDTNESKRVIETVIACLGGES